MMLCGYDASVFIVSDIPAVSFMYFMSHKYFFLLETRPLDQHAYPEVMQCAERDGCPAD